jgi:mannitol-specific phosphotransferase system IIBC component
MSAGTTIEGKTILGTVSGTVLTVAVNIDSSDLLKTVVLAALGAVVSFVVTVALKRVCAHLNFFQKKRKK